MRKSLEELQSKHTADMEALQQKLDDAESKKEQAETQFQMLLERVNTIKSQLGERLKEDAVRGPEFTTQDIWLILPYRRNWL
jgi:flagellar biosynthesis chaperone FliJ